MMLSPYSFSDTVLDPNMFYGYQNIIQEDIVPKVTAPQRARQSFFVVGGRYMGKTSLLRQVERELEEHKIMPLNGNSRQIVIPFYFDDAKKLFGRAAYLLHTCLTENNNVFPPNRISNEVKRAFEAVETSARQFETFKRALSTLTQAIAIDRVQLRLVFLLDDLWRQQRPETVTELSRNLHALHSEPSLQHVVAYVIAGSFHDLHGSLELRNMSNRETLLDGFLLYRDLHVLDKKEALKLINNPTGNQIRPAVADQIYEESGGHPYLLQYLMRKLCDTCDSEENLQQLTGENVEQAKIDFDTDRGGFESWWKQLNEIDKTVYEELCQLYDQYPADEEARQSSAELLGNRALSVPLGRGRSLIMDRQMCKYSLHILSTAGFLRAYTDDFYAVAGRWPMRKFLETRI